MPTIVGSLRGCKRMELGFFNGSFRCLTMAIFQTTREGFCVHGSKEENDTTMMLDNGNRMGVPNWGSRM